METVSSCSSCSTTKGVDHCFITVYLLGQNPVSARETESKGCGLYHQVDVSVLCNTISSVRILSCFVKCGHCLLLLQIFTSGLFPLLLGRGSLLCNPGLSRNCPSFCASMHPWHLPHPAMVGTLAPVVSTTIPRTVSPAFPQSWNESGGGGGGCLVSHSPHSRCFFQISKAPQGHTPHLALPPLHLASPITILAQLVCSLQACPSSELARLPQVTLWQASQGPMALRTCPRDTCRMLRATPRPPEQVVF